MPDPIPVIKFYKRKYGDELLVDIVTAHLSLLDAGRAAL